MTGDLLGRLEAEAAANAEHLARAGGLAAGPVSTSEEPPDREAIRARLDALYAEARAELEALVRRTWNRRALP